MKKVGFIGWRGMVGSVLLERMKKKKNFEKIIPMFFSTTQKGKKIFLSNNKNKNTIEDAYNIDLLMSNDIIVTCQGSYYTKKIYSKIRNNGWNGYWIDAASYLRMKNDSTIVLDPINYDLILKDIDNGIKNFVGGNCTVSLMLMSLGGLVKEKLIDWIYFSSYQAVSGAGASAMLELIKQIKKISNNINIKHKLNFSTKNILSIEKKITKISQLKKYLPINVFKIPIICNTIPWIDNKMENGQTMEEHKSISETNKILGYKKKKILVDGNCVRISALRCHSQSFMIHLKKDISISSIYNIIKNNNKWVNIIPNEKEQTIEKLNPIKVSGTLNIPIGRIRKLNIGKKYISAFSVGDQLLWGAAEPIRRVLKIILKNI
ncbi:aspartate-semialdehyde dehydrogenase [Buchnera aphidicola (Taiwanaphis decaspermi)]|uniref:aspartate-semialdehyde dehydrogenase n=1 Tax=Buchnera aphidicola TaxID=9 RepID=UPI0031B821F9